MNPVINSILGYSSLEAIVVYHKNQAISLKQLLSDLIFLDQQLPAHRYILNLYEDRYYFLLGLLLGIKRNSTHLFPSNITRHTLTYLQENYTQIMILNSSGIDIDAAVLFDLEELLSAKKPEDTQWPTINMEYFFSDIDIETALILMFTSGSTGAPKPFAKKWRDFIDVAAQLGKQLGLNREKETAVLATVPAQHMYGLEVSIMMPLVNGLAIHAERPFYPADIAQLLTRTDRPTVLITTPVHLRACMQTRVTLSFLQLCLSATAPLDREVAENFERTHKTRLMEIYGCTEVGVIATRRPVSSERWQCLDDIQLCHVSAEEIQLGTCRSIQNFLLNDHVSEVDKHSFLLHGRKHELINIAGKRTSLSYLNHHLLNIEQVRDGCFYQLDTADDIQQRLVVFIVADRNNTTLKKTITRCLQNKIEPVFLPRCYYFIDQLPRNKTGKINYNDMKNLYHDVNNRRL